MGIEYPVYGVKFREISAAFIRIELWGLKSETDELYLGDVVADLDTEGKILKFDPAFKINKQVKIYFGEQLNKAIDEFEAAPEYGKFIATP